MGKPGCKKRFTADGLVRNVPGYGIFYNMLERCYNSKCKQYPRYGGRGITVCDRWREGGFAVFIADMGPRPSAKHSIDRFPDNNGNYEPGNCRWATAKEQGRNRRDNVTLTHNGETLTLAEWSERTGISHDTLRERLAKGHPTERILDPTPIQVDWDEVRRRTKK